MSAKAQGLRSAMEQPGHKQNAAIARQRIILLSTAVASINFTKKYIMVGPLKFDSSFLLTLADSSIGPCHWVIASQVALL